MNKLECELKQLPSRVELLFHGKAEDEFSTELEGQSRPVLSSLLAVGRVDEAAESGRMRNG